MLGTKCNCFQYFCGSCWNHHISYKHIPIPLRVNFCFLCWRQAIIKQNVRRQNEEDGCLLQEWTRFFLLQTWQQWHTMFLKDVHVEWSAALKICQHITHLFDIHGMKRWQSYLPVNKIYIIKSVSGIMSPPKSSSTFLRTRGNVSRASAASGESAAAT